MPNALYAISYEQTGLVLSFCELAKQDLSKAGAVQALLDQIVGDKLDVSFEFLVPGMSASSIEIDKSLLNVDEVNVDPKDIPTTTDFMTAWLNRLAATTPPPPDPPLNLDLLMLDLSDALAKAGDGKVKKLLASSDMFKATPTLTTASLSVALGSSALAKTKFYAFVDGQPQQTFIAGATGSNPITFNFTVPLLTKTWHSVVFASASYQPFFGLLKVP